MQSLFICRATAPALAVCALLLAMAPARAGIFDDDEARKAILDLRARIAQSDDTHRSELAAAVRGLTEQIQLQQRNQLDLSNQLEALRAELAKERGKNELLARDVADLQRRLKDAQQLLEDRLRKLEPQKVVLDGKEFLVANDERKAYDDAVAQLRTGDFDRALAALNGFMRRYPDSGYANSARYWLGNAQYARRECKDAMVSFRSFASAVPDSPQAPEALLAVANCQVELKDTKAARKTLEELLKQYPKAEAAQAAKERLAALK